MLHALLLVLVGILLYVPYFAAEELDDEEGRRAIPAREMVESGDYVVPRVFGEPYLAKPPFYFWSVAAASLLTGRVNEAATRLPSVLATIATALAVFGFARGRWGEQAGLASGLLLLCTLAVFEKGAFGELEAMFSLLCFLSAACVLTGRSLAGGLFLGAALLTKGPAALVFVGAPAVARAIVARSLRPLVARSVWIPLVTGTLLAGIWVVLLFDRLEASQAMSRWSGEVVRGDGQGLAAYLGDRWRFLLGMAVGLFPASALWLLSLRTDLRGRILADPVTRTVEWTLVLGFAFFFLMPGTRPRYAYPLAPWMAVLGGGILAAALADPAWRKSVLEKRLAVGLRVLAAVGLLAAAAAGYLTVGSIGDLAGLEPPGAALAIALSGAALLLLRSSLRPGLRALWLGFCVLALLRGIQLFEVVPRTAGHRGRKAAAAEIARALPEGAVLHVRSGASSGMNNELFYLEGRAVEASDLAGLAPGSFALVETKRLDELRGGSLEAHVVGTTDVHGGRRFAVVRLEPRAPRSE